jgi:putative ABC transport system permease protein
MKWLSLVLTDARFALRLLRRKPAFGATLLGVLVLGIGATTAMFSLVVSLLVRPLPYPSADELTVIRRPGSSSVSLPDVLDWRAQGTTFASMAAMESASFSLSSAGEPPEYVPGTNVSGDYFSVFAIPPLRGRLLGPDDDKVGGPRVAVLSAQLWHRRFASDPGLVGRAITLNGEAYTIVGIAAEGFRFASSRSSGADVWTPLAVTRRTYARELTQRGTHYLDAIGRRKPGVSLDQARAQLSGIAATLAAAYPESNAGTKVEVVDLREALVGSSREGVWILFAAVGLVFLVVCANIANLLLARAASRRAEMAARAALGATRGRLVAQLVTETVVVFVVAALGGAFLAHWLVDIFAEGLMRGGGVWTIAFRVDAIALACSITTAIVCGLVFGLVPALEASRVSPQEVLKESGARSSMNRSQRFVRGGLVIAQVAIAFALLVGSGLALRAFAKVAATSPGFDPENVATAAISLPGGKYADPDKVALFYRDVAAAIAAQPGVESASGNSSLPMAGSNWDGSFKIEGREPWPVGSEPTLERNVVLPGYFETMRIPILRGRGITEADVKDRRRVMVISQKAAEMFFPGADPIGQRIDWGSEEDDEVRWCEIVGIVGDVRKWALSGPVLPEGYVPVAQQPVRWMTLAIRAARPDALLRDLPAVVARVDPEQAVSSLRPMSYRVDASVGPDRFVTRLLGAFAVAALLLSTLGIFGLVSYTTSQRTRELGIRFALGSSPEGVIALVMREGVRLLTAGLVLGLAGALFAGRAIAGRVYGAVSFDLLVFGTILGVLALAGLLASFLPALRAVRISPAVALRYE